MRRLLPAVLSLVLGAWSAPSLAEPRQPAEIAVPTADAPQGMTKEELAEFSGGDAVDVHVTTNQQLTATHSGNTVNAGSLTSGEIAFSADALSGFSGIGNFVVNTGANNTLQGSISVNIVTAPLP